MLSRLVRKIVPSRWLAPFQGGFAIGTTSQTPTVARVYLELFEVTVPTVVDAISISNGATVAGNVTVGVYGPIATEETCSGAALVVQGANTAQSGTSTGQTFTFTATLLAPGRYYAAVEFDDATATFLRHGANFYVTGYVQYYDRAGGYGTLTNPCPAPSNTSAVAPALRVRCSVA